MIASLRLFPLRIEVWHSAMTPAFSLSSLPPAYLSTSMFQKNWTGDLIRPLTLSR